MSATARVTRTRTIPVPRPTVWDRLGDLTSLAGLIDGLQEVRPLDGGGHLFMLRPIHALGQRFQPGAKLVVAFVEPERVAFSPTAESADAADAHGTVTLTPTDDGGTHVQVAADVRLQLPLPRLLGGAASALLGHELRTGFDAFLDNLATAATAT